MHAAVCDCDLCQKREAVFVNVDPDINGELPPGWVVVERDDAAALFEDDLEAARWVSKSVRWLDSADPRVTVNADSPLGKAIESGLVWTDRSLRLIVPALDAVDAGIHTL